MAEAISTYNPSEQPQTEGTPQNDLRLLSVNEARKKLGIRYESLKSLIQEGKIEVIVIEGKIKIPEIKLRQFIIENSKRIKPPEEHFIKNVPKSIQETLNRIINKYK